jgi:putative FmdB family regulatory protein
LIFEDPIGGESVPLYEYKCLKCSRRTEKIEKVSGPHLKKCPHCGGKVESVITAPAIQFKGAGWYVTDYAGKSTDGGSKEATAPAETKEAGGQETAGKESAGKEKDGATKETVSKELKESRDSKESKEKKPAKKK